MRIIPDKEPWNQRVVSFAPAAGWISLNLEGVDESRRRIWFTPVVGWVALRDYDEKYHGDNDQYEPGVDPLICMREHPLPMPQDEGETLHVSEVAFVLSLHAKNGYRLYPCAASILTNLGVDVSGISVAEEVQ